MCGKILLTYKQVLEIGSDAEQLKSIPYFPILEPEKTPFCYVSTSGTTGQPKRVVHSQLGFTRIMSALILPGAQGLKWVHQTTMGHTSGTVMLGMLFLSGMTGVMFRDGNNLDFICASIERHKMYGFVMSPDLGPPMAKGDYHKKYDLSSLKVVLHMGVKFADHVVDALQDNLGVTMRNLYGSSEFFGHMLINESELRKPNYYYGSVGHIRPGAQMKVIDVETGDSLPPNKQGELLFRGPQCFMGYLGNDDATKEALDDEGWFHSGDLGYYDETGRLFVMDRLKEMIKYASFTLAPVEIEEFLMRHDAVAAAAVVGVDHAMDLKWPRAYVELEKDKSATEQELLDYVAGKEWEPNGACTNGIHFRESCLIQTATWWHSFRHQNTSY